MSASERIPSTMSEGVEVLRSWREENLRRSEEVLDIWDTLLSDENPTAFGEERWMILEQVGIAAMDLYRIDVVNECLKQLRIEFGKESNRVRRLYAMRCEINEDYKHAIEIYDSILQEDDANSQARKRKIAIFKATQDIPRAISELNRYIKDFMNDGEAWMELCDLYILEQEYAKAAFCCEELILTNPNNHLYFQRYAEIRYTQGGSDNMDLAKTYFSKAVSLNPDNMRALYGLLLTTSQLASSPKCMAQKKKEYLKLVAWAAKQISTRYAEKKNPIVPKAMLDGLLGQHQLASTS